MNKTAELGSAPIHKLLFKYALPAIIAMTATSLYNIVDSIYIGHGCGALALGALTVAKPFMDICAAFGSLVGVGASSLLAIYLGEKDYEKANRVLGNVIVLNIILSAIVMAIGLIWLDPILMAFGASEDTLVYAHEYMEINHPVREYPDAYLFRSQRDASLGRPSAILHDRNDSSGSD